MNTYDIEFYAAGHLLEISVMWFNAREWAGTMGYCGDAEVAFIMPH